MRDRDLLDRWIKGFDNQRILTKLPWEIAVEIGKLFLGFPYRTGPLETNGEEKLVVDLKKFDCVTFIETVMALVRLVSLPKKSFETFRSLLQKIRYRGGRIRGYPSRLHYFADWIHDNERKGFVMDVTGELGGTSRKRKIHFMTSHPDLYPPLKDAANLRRMKAIERSISARPCFSIPKGKVMRSEDRIQDGDIIAITSRSRGLDVQHVGFAIRLRNRIHLLHASSKEGRVVVSSQTLYRYLMQGRDRAGIMVARIKDGK